MELCTNRRCLATLRPATLLVPFLQQLLLTRVPVSHSGVYGRTSKLPVHLLTVICDQWPLI